MTAVIENKRRRVWGEVMNRIQKDDVGKVDYTVPVDHLKMTDHGDVIDTYNMFNGAGYLRPNEYALGQIFSRCGIPADYGRKCYDEEPSMISGHVNHWMEQKAEKMLEKANDREWFVRAKGNSMRAILTDRYTQLDNEYFFDALSMNLSHGSAVDMKMFDISPVYLHARMVFPDLAVNVGTDLKPDVVHVGVHMINSEVGASSVRIVACLYRQVCSNGLVVPVDGSMSAMAQRHSYIPQNELQRMVAEALGKAIKAGDTAIDKFARAREVKVEEPIDLIMNLAKGQKYSKTVIDAIQSSYLSNPTNNSVFDVVNAFTDGAKVLPSLERRVEVETFAGNWMNKMVK